MSPRGCPAAPFVFTPWVAVLLPCLPAVGPPAFAPGHLCDVGAAPAGSEAASEQGQEEEVEDRLKEHMDNLLDKR